MDKHTPGPWEVDIEYGRVLASDQRKTIVVDSFGGSIKNPEVLSDARLIAAAPELLEALEAMLNADDGSVLKARHAVAKARGE